MASEDVKHQVTALHGQICQAWQRHQELRKALMSLQADTADLSADLERISERARQLYMNSENVLNGEPPTNDPEPS